MTTDHATKPGSAAPFARFRLLVVGKTRMESFRLPTSGEITIGRSPECFLSLDDLSVGERHAALQLGWPMTLHDLGSGHATLVGSERLVAGAAVAVSPGTVITLGGVVLALQSIGASTRLRHVRSHDYFEGRLDDECARVELAGGTFAVARFACAPHARSLLEGAFTECLRAMDVVATYSLDEYEVLLVDAAPSDGLAIVNEIRLRMRAAGIEQRAGLACYPQDARTPEGLVAAAGDALHGATRSSPPAVDDGVIQRLQPVLERLAASTLPVLILGETGVGKEVMTNAIHRLSPRATKPFLRINCASMSETLLESELFGYERGAFTGAVKSKAGLLETAHGGTVFLDEVGEMPLTVQAKLLRVLEQKEIMRLGALSPRSIDVRFLAATNRDLEEQVEKGGFRRDLFFRLNGFTLAIPPLRERVGEIEALARVFIEEACLAAGRSSPPQLSRDAIAMLRRYAWPGNVRELRNVIERAVLLHDGPVIGSEHLPADRLGRTLPPPRIETPHEPFTPLPSSAIVRPESRPSSRPSYVPASASSDERDSIVRALESCGGNQTKAAQLLGVSRRTLISRLEQYALPRPKKQA